MKIAIPSYNRAEKLSQKTYKVLIDNGVPETDIIVFVASEDQKELYKQFLPNTEIIVGCLGMCNIRNFMTNYFEEGEIIVYMDDDIEKIKTKGKTFLEALEDCYEYLKTSKTTLIGLPPTFNEYFNKTSGFKTGLLVAIGCFYIQRNDKQLVKNTIVEDLERTILCFLKYGETARYCDLMVKTKPFAEGGVNDADGRNYEKYYNSLARLYYEYSQLLNISSKKIGYISNKVVPHLRFKSLKKPPILKQDLIVMPPVHKELFDPLLNMLQGIKLTIKVDEEYAKKHNGNFRKNFPKHRADIFGIVKLRNGGGFALSRSSVKRPLLYEELKRIGDIIVPFKYSSILVNNNTICGKHLDASNISSSLIVSIGEYEGCKLNVKGINYDTKYTPVIIDGSKLEHSTTDDLVGEKYSLVYYQLIPIAPSGISAGQ